MTMKKKEMMIKKKEMMMKKTIIIHSLKLTAKAPENRPSQKENCIPTIHFQVRYVSFREGNFFFSRNTSQGQPSLRGHRETGT